MEFRKNLEAIKEVNRGSESQPEMSTMKEAINQLLFQIMPPTTTLVEMEDLASAIFQTVYEAWSSEVIPDGMYLKDDLDGGRLVPKETK